MIKKHKWEKDKTFTPEQVVKNKATCLVCGCLIYKISFMHFDKRITFYKFVLNDKVLDDQPKCK